MDSYSNGGDSGVGTVMNLKCSTCGTKKPKTEDGKFISVDTGEWDSSFWLYCSDECKRTNN